MWHRNFTKDAPKKELGKEEAEKEEEEDKGGTEKKMVAAMKRKGRCARTRRKYSQNTGREHTFGQRV